MNLPKKSEFVKKYVFAIEFLDGLRSVKLNAFKGREKNYLGALQCNLLVKSDSIFLLINIEYITFNVILKMYTICAMPTSP